MKSSMLMYSLLKLCTPYAEAKSSGDSTVGIEKWHSQTSTLPFICIYL